MAHAQAAGSLPNQSLNIFSQPLSIFGVPVDRETIFTNNQGVYYKRIEKRQRRMIIKTTFIKFFLHKGERIRCLTTGYSPVSMLEQLLTGPAFLFFKRAFIIFSDLRILFIPTYFNRSSRGAISQIRYDDCATIQLKGRSLIVQYKNGQQEVFPYVGRKEKKKIRALIQSIPLTPKESGRLKARVDLCPSCTNELNADAALCGTCKLQFKSNLQAKIRALVIPGGGYFYSRRPIAGLMVGLIEIGLMGFLIYQWMALKNGVPVSFSILTFFCCALIIEKYIAAFHSEQLVCDHIPEEKDFAMRKI
jgi:hypothetical protein